MPKKKATSSDVARKAGVSQATVSMVLNRKYNVSFSRETVEKVEQAARELGYQLPGRKNKKDSRHCSRQAACTYKERSLSEGLRERHSWKTRTCFMETFHADKQWQAGSDRLCKRS